MNDRYEVREMIGEGGLGAVFRGWDRNLDRDVAIKRVRTVTGENADARMEALLREARTLSHLQHPNIVTVYDAGQDGEGAFIVMELLKGETLEDIITRGALTGKDFEQLATQSLDGLIAAHALDLIHLDLKPQNVMLTWHASGQFQVKLLDFGLAKITRHPSEQDTDDQGAIMGSIFFMAPEQFERAPVDQRTDLYALGAIFYYALTQQYPFQGDTGPQVMVSHLYHRFTPLAKLRPDLPPHLHRWVEWLFSRKPSQRPATAAEALAVLKAGRFPDEDIPVAVAVVEEPAAKPAAPALKRPATASAPVALGGAALTPSPAGTAAVFPRPQPQPARKGFPKWAWFTLPPLIVLVLGYATLRIMQASREKARQERFAELAAAEKPEGSDVDVRLLLEYLESPKSSAAAAQALSHLQGGGYIDAILLDHLGKTRSREAQGNLLKVLGLRGITVAFPDVMRFVDAPSADIRRSAWTALGMITTAENVGALIEKLGQIDPKDMEFAEQAAVSAITESGGKTGADPIIRAFRLGFGSDAYRSALLRILGRVGGRPAFDVLVESLGAPSAEIRKAASTALGMWPDSEALPPLAGRFPVEKDPAVRLILLTAATNAVAQPGALPQAALFESARSLYDTARDSREKAQAVAALSRIIDPAVIEFFNALAMQEPSQKDKAEAIARLLRDSLAKMVLASDETVLAPEQADFSRAGGLRVAAGILVNWMLETDWASWMVNFSRPGTYELSVTQACTAKTEGAYEVVVAGSRIETSAVRTRDASDFKSFILGKVKVAHPGVFKLWLKPTAIPENEHLFRLKSLELKRIGD